MIKYTFKILSLVGLLMAGTVHASDLSDAAGVLQKHSTRISLNYVQMVELNQCQPQWLLNYFSQALDVPELVLAALEETGFPLHEPTHDDVVAFLTGLKAYQQAHHNQFLNLDLPEDLNATLNTVASRFDPSEPLAINLYYCQLTRIPSLLPCLTQLTSLSLHNNNLRDISALAGLTQLKTLELSSNRNGLSDISALAGLTQLTKLYLAGNKLTDISALAGLTQLTKLYLDGNAPSDISALAGLTQLKVLNLNFNGLTNISALAGLTQLKTLELSSNRLSDISALAGLTQLTMLNLIGNPVVVGENLEATRALFLPKVQISIIFGNSVRGTRQ